jgi:hypothetical protein
MQELNIVDLIENNPITKLSSDYNGKLLNKIKENFSGFEQQLFLSSFYCYLNHHPTNDFVIDLDNVWKWLGFSQKVNAKSLLEKQFLLNNDYTKSLLLQQKGTNCPVKGGQNKQTIMLNVKTFKSLCLKAGTKKADEIHEYYMKMEEILQELVEEESDELKLQLEQKDNIILEIKQTTENEKLQLTKENLQLTKDKQKEVEKATIVQFPLNTECIYIGTIDNTNEANEKLIKFGHTNDLNTRVLDHHKQYDNFVLLTAFRVQNKVEIENLIKTYPKIKRQIRSIQVNGKNKTELIAYDTTFTIDKLIKYIKDIIHSKTYSIDNFNRVMLQNETLTAELTEMKLQLEQDKIIMMKQSIEINELKELLQTQKSTLDAVKIDNQSVYQNVLIPEDELTQKFNEFITTQCIVRTDVEEGSTTLEGAYRIWSGIKPQKEVFHALKHYLDTRFKPSRLTKQDKDQVVHGYIGVKLLPIEYKKTSVGSNVETFLFQVCKFSPNGKILNSTLLDEYQRWKKSVGKDTTDKDIVEIKEYLNSCEYVLKATVWTERGSNEGYYGISLKQDEFKYKTTSSTGKNVEKIEVISGNILATWQTIVKASVAENISAAKMSRSIKNKTIFNDYFYSIKTN